MRLKQYILSTVILLLAARLSSLEHVGDSPSKAQREAVVAADISNGLGWKVFSCLSSSTSLHNLLFSPVSLATSFSILYYGALGNSSVEIRCEISSLLQPSSLPSQCNGSSGVMKEEEPVAINDKTEQCSDCPPGVYFKALLSTLAVYNNTNWTVDVANGIWHRGHLHSLFKQSVNNYFRPQLMTLDPEKPITAASEINQWVTNTTRGKISNIINPESIHENDKFFLFNVLYFRGLWRTSFTLNESIKSFTTCTACNANDVNLTAEGSMEQVQYIEKKMNVPYYKMATLSAIRIPYANNDLSMTIILPNLCSMMTVEDQLINGNLLQRINSRLTPRKIKIILPKFDLEQELPIDSILSKLGLCSLQSGGYSTILKKSDDLQLSKVSHKSVLEVNEQGMNM